MGVFVQDRVPAWKEICRNLKFEGIFKKKKKNH